jgi:hypothetical protein
MNVPQKDKAVKIPDMFAKRPTTKCPICNVGASLKEIDRHLDEGCPQVVESIELSEVKDQEEEIFVDSDTEYEKVDLSTEERPNDVISDSNTRKADLLSKERPMAVIPDYKKTDISTDESDFVVIRASQSVSNAPKRFGGIDQLSSIGQVAFK